MPAGTLASTLRTKGRFLQEQPTAAPTVERQVSAAADIGPRNLSDRTQSDADYRSATWSYVHLGSSPLSSRLHRRAYSLK